MTNTFKNIFIIHADLETWNDFLLKIKSNSNIYHLRQHKYKILHNYWVLKYKNTLKLTNDLNFNNTNSSEISNFYFNISAKNFKHRYIMFYYFNKLVFIEYPYFYWVNKSLYTNSQVLTKKNTTSKNMKIQLFFMYIHVNKLFVDNSTESFVKLKFNTFKGASTFFNNLKHNYYYFNISKINIKKALNDSMYINAFKSVNTQLVVTHKYNQIKNKNLNNNIILNIIANNLFLFTEKIFEFKDVKTNTFFMSLKNLTLYWYTKVHNTTINVSKNTLVLYLRAAKHFNKGRYSRNRQLYRTGVYWCIWLNVVIVYALHYYFYRVVFAFGYLWLPLGIMVLTVFSSRLYKYRFYSLTQILIEFKEYNNLIFFFFLKVKLLIKYKCFELLNMVKRFIINYKNLLMVFLYSISNFIKKYI